jgi:hypothetical protein
MNRFYHENECDESNESIEADKREGIAGGRKEELKVKEAKSLRI